MYVTNNFVWFWGGAAHQTRSRPSSILSVGIPDLVGWWDSFLCGLITRIHHFFFSFLAFFCSLIGWWLVDSEELLVHKAPITLLQWPWSHRTQVVWWPPRQQKRADLRWCQGWKWVNVTINTTICLATTGCWGSSGLQACSSSRPDHLDLQC